jgi:hypothetical protein
VLNGIGGADTAHCALLNLDTFAAMTKERPDAVLHPGRSDACSSGEMNRRPSARVPSTHGVLGKAVCETAIVTEAQATDAAEA